MSRHPGCCNGPGRMVDAPTLPHGMPDDLPAPFRPKAVDRTGWPRGEWDDEPDFEAWTDERTGLYCAAIRNLRLGHWCGYVAVAGQHPLHGVDYMDLSEIDGLEAVSYSCLGADPRLYWFGFYLGHRSMMPGYVTEDCRDAVYHPLPAVRLACVALSGALSRTAGLPKRGAADERGSA